MREFEWMMDSEENHYSSWYKELLRTGESTMSEETFRKIASIFDIDADTIVEEITTLRKNFKQELIDMYEEDVETFTDISLDAYVQNAFPYEFILKDRY